MPTTTSASSTAAQNGSNSGKANERRRPLKSGTGAGRMRMALAPRDTTHSSSSIAFSTIGSVMTGVGKMRPSKLKVHCSCIHWLNAWMTTWVATGSSASRSSSRLASVGHIIARSMLSSSMSITRASGSKNPGQRLDVLRRRLELDVFGPGRRRRVLEPELELLAPGGATLLNVGFGMYSLILFLIAIFVRPLISTYLITPAYCSGRYRVKASFASYMWLSASNTGYGSLRDISDLRSKGRAASLNRTRPNCAA